MKLATMIVTFIKKVIRKALAPYLKSNLRCMRRSNNINKIGISGGYCSMLSQNSPLSNNMNARWKPQPGHGKPSQLL